MTDHEVVLQVLRPLRPHLAEVAQAAHATEDPSQSLDLARRLICAALDADFVAIDRLARRALHRSHVAAGSR